MVLYLNSERDYLFDLHYRNFIIKKYYFQGFNLIRKDRLICLAQDWLCFLLVCSLAYLAQDWIIIISLCFLLVCSLAYLALLWINYQCWYHQIDQGLSWCQIHLKMKSSCHRKGLTPKFVGLFLFQVISDSFRTFKVSYSFYKIFIKL